MFAKSLGMARREIGLPNSVRYFPIVFFEAFLLMTVAVFAFGPWDWPVANPVELYLYLFINQLALLFGYVSAVRGRLLPASFRLPLAVKDLTWLAALATLVMLPPTIIWQTGGDIDLVRALTDPGRAYSDTYWAASFATATRMQYINIVLSPLIWALLPLTVVFWNRFSPLLKNLAVIGILGGSFVFLLTGTNKRNVDIMLLLPWLLVIRSKNPSTIQSRSAFFCFVSQLYLL